MNATFDFSKSLGVQIPIIEDIDYGNNTITLSDNTVIKCHTDNFGIEPYHQEHINEMVLEAVKLKTLLSIQILMEKLGQQQKDIDKIKKLTNG
jgi:hypothetical protein